MNAAPAVAASDVAVDVDVMVDAMTTWILPPDTRT